MTKKQAPQGQEAASRKPNAVDKRSPAAAAGSELSEADLANVAGGATDVVSPRDSASGLPTGKRMHKPYSV